MRRNHKTLTKLQNLDIQRQRLKDKKNKWIFAYFLFPAMIILGISFTGIFQLIMFTSSFAVIISRILYTFHFTTPFIELTEGVKEALLDEFMKIYHPTISHSYIGKDYKAASIIERSELISADRYKEEDVISGTKGNTHFYLSEVKLQKKNGDGDTYSTVFKGLLFKIKIKGRTFPKSQLYSQPTMYKRLFGVINKHETFGFWYETANQAVFLKEMQSLFPFIRHLSQQGQVRISVQGDEITILMESKMKFLDDPKFSLNKPFQNEEYYAKMSQQMNSLLFIIDSFTDELTPIEIEEELKLRVIEYAKNQES